MRTTSWAWWSGPASTYFNFVTVCVYIYIYTYYVTIERLANDTAIFPCAVRCSYMTRRTGFMPAYSCWPQHDPLSSCFGNLVYRRPNKWSSKQQMQQMANLGLFGSEAPIPYSGFPSFSAWRCTLGITYLQVYSDIQPNSFRYNIKLVINTQLYPYSWW